MMRLPGLLQRAGGLLLNPKHVVPVFLKRWPWATYRDRLAWDAVDRPHYYYGVLHAALEAKALGLERISVLELGVAGGNGLCILERIAAEVSTDVGVAIEVHGFDGGSGMPPPVDYRDLPHVWNTGFFRMDEAKLRARLTTASLHLGDVGETIPRFLAEARSAPIGFVSFDLDYYSSTAAALALFDAPDAGLLPRVFCYFDDIICDEWTYMSRFAGELLAIDEFNGGHQDRKISPIIGLSWLRHLPAKWNDEMYVLHCFAHPLYARHIHPNREGQLGLFDRPV